MAVLTVVKRVLWIIALACGAYILSLSLFTNETIQRYALYAHKVGPWWQDLNRPEQWGFLKNQVQPFRLSTPDGELLYAWHVLPTALYAEREDEILRMTSDPAEDSTNTIVFRLLKNDPQSRLIISFHGNAGTVAQGWRTDTYRAMASGSVSKIHVLTADYRGFGYSTGTPTESGLIIDGIALVSWALEIAQIPPERIVLVGHSLGTAVATAVVEHFTVQHHVDFAGVVLVAAFLDLPTLMLTYSGGGIVPLLSPLQAYPPLQQYLLRHFKDRWHTCSRLINMVRQSEKLNLVLIHALDDKNIPWTHSSDLFFAAANATSNSDLTKKQIDGVKQHVYLGHQGWTNTWSAGSGENGLKRIQQIVLKHGGHNRLMTYPAVSKAISELFDR